MRLQQRRRRRRRRGDDSGYFRANRNRILRLRRKRPTPMWILIKNKKKTNENDTVIFFHTYKTLAFEGFFFYERARTNRYFYQRSDFTSTEIRIERFHTRNIETSN